MTTHSVELGATTRGRCNQPPSKEVSSTLTASAGKCGDNQPSIIAEGGTLAYDGYNQSAHREVSQTIRTASGGEADDRTVKGAYGINANCARSDMCPCDRELGQTLSVCHKDGAVEVNPITQLRYIVRRLTPVETERLQGLPDNYTIPSGLEVTDELVEEFRQIHDNFSAIMANYAGKKPPKGKTANQVRKWLEKITNPETCPDAPRYKAVGNGWATNHPRFILTRLLAYEGIDPWEVPTADERGGRPIAVDHGAGESSVDCTPNFSPTLTTTRYGAPVIGDKNA